MKKLIIHSFAAAAAVLLVAACSKQAPAPQADKVLAEVTLGIDGIQDGRTKAAEGLYPEVENWIFDFFYVQFNADGIAVSSGHCRTDVTVGDMTVTETVTLVSAQGQSTVAFVANVTPAGHDYSYVPAWESGSVVRIADNIETYKTLKFDMTERLSRAEAGTLRHTPMCGYWTGHVDGATRLQATLGRMIVRMNVHVTNESGAALTQVALRDAAAKAYIFPQVDNTPLDASADYIDIPANTVSIRDGESTTLCFYTAPNFCDGAGGKRTSLTFTKAGGQTATLELGNEAEAGDYNLNMNTIYNYSITVK